MANHQEDDRKEEGARAGPRGHPHATDMQTHTGGVLDEQRQAEQQEARGIRGYGEPAFPGLRAVRHAGHPASTRLPFGGSIKSDNFRSATSVMIGRERRAIAESVVCRGCGAAHGDIFACAPATQRSDYITRA